MLLQNKSKNKIFSITILLLLSFLMLGLGAFFVSQVAYADTAESEVQHGEYLSNLTPISQSIGYRDLMIDKNVAGDKISFIVGDERKYFDKGLIAHATSTLVYDIGQNHPYDYFSTYLGVDAGQSGKGNVKFFVYSSSDNENWTTQLDGAIKTSGDEAIFLEFSLENVRYIKFYFDSNGSNANDHSGLGDCKLYSSGYNFDEDSLIKSVEYYNDLFKGKAPQDILNNYTLQLMQRKFVDDIGYKNLKINFLIGEEEQSRREMLNWLYNDSSALRDFVTGGTPNGGNYLKALNVLTRLYKAHSKDLLDTTALFQPEANSTRTRKDVYRTMMIAIALTNAKDVYGWVNSNDILDPLARYEAFKYTYLASNFHLRYDIFENLCVEEMRYLMSSRINSEEIYWLNAYATTKYLEKNSAIKYPSVYSPHPHIRYGRDWNYKEKGYYKEENFEQYNNKYMLGRYGVHLTTTPRLWMAMEGSQICWGISYLGTNFASAFGVPSHYVRQPDHAAFFVYDKDSNGRSVWTIDNDIFGWTKTWMNEDTVGNGNNRMMCDWGTVGSEQVKHSNGTYILLSATALDNQECYEKAELVLSLKSFVGEGEQEELFRYALSIMPYHFDAWYDLVKLYIANDKSDVELTSLAEEIAQNMYCFPLPMHELLGLIETELTKRATDSATIQLANLRNIDNLALQRATKVNSDDFAKNLIAQTAPCIEEAKYLLGIVEDTKLATFSFDGEEKNKLVFNSSYTSVRYKYSLDGGATWSDTLVTSSTPYEFTASELDCITSTSDIYVWLEGWGTIDLNKAFKIDIVDGVAISGLEMNDNENKFFGTFDKVEYSLDNVTWHDLDENSLFLGEKTVYVRNKRQGTTLQGEETTFTFIDNTNSTRNYVPISFLELFDFSSEEASQKDYASHVIDGKLSTRWHTKWKGGDYDRYVTIKFDKNRYISGLDYTPVGGNGTMYACEVYASVDGKNWTKVASSSNWANNSVKKQMTFTPVYCQYVKVVGSNTVGGFCSARMIEFFEDTTLYTKDISKLIVEDMPKQKVYVVGQTINYVGLKVLAEFLDDTTAIIPSQLLTLDNTTFAHMGSHKITIKYLNKQTSFEVKVIDVKDGVARVGVNYFSSLKDAISSVLDGNEEENIVELLKDVKVDAEYSITKEIVINGNGHTLSRGENFLTAIFVVSGTGKLTLNNLVLDGGAVWTGETNEILERGTTNSGITSTGQLIKLTGSATLVVDNCTLQNNYNNYFTNAQNAGGAIFLGGNSSAILSNTTIKNCFAYTFGSAIYTRDSSKLEINSGKFLGNSGSAQNNTTVICVDNSSTCVINGCEIVNNLANDKGGVFWVNGRLDINGGLFKNNYATKGSGIYLNANAKVNIADFEEMGEIYLPNGKFIYLLSPLFDKTLNIKMENNALGSTVAVCEDEEVKYKVLKAIVVADKLLYVEDNNIKLGDLSIAKTSIKYGDRETLFVGLIDAIKGAQANDVITLKTDVLLEDVLEIETPLAIDLASYTFEGIDKITTKSLCKVTYADNLIEVCAHKYNLNVTYAWSEDYATCTAVGYCECGEAHSESVKTIKTITTPANYESEEYSTFVAEFECKDFATQEKRNVLTGEKLKKPNESANKANLAIILSICGGGIVVAWLVVFLATKKKTTKKEENNKKTTKKVKR